MSNRVLGLVLVMVVVLAWAATASAEGIDDMSLTVSVAVRAFAQAIAKAEGFFVMGSLPQRANNPGDLTKGDFGDTGQYLGAENLIVFATVEDGWHALYRKLQHIAAGASMPYPRTMTIAAMGLRYSGGDPNWGVNVARVLNVPITSAIGSVLDGI